jgi:hypothetical protein
MPRTPEPIPSDADAKALTLAIANNFPGCSCHAHNGWIHTCDAHAFIQERDRLVVRWQKLLFYRAMAPRFRAEEGLRTQTRVDARGRLPW